MRDISPEEARDEAVYELTAIHCQQLRLKLQGGNAELANAIDEAISHEMGGTFWRDLVIAAAYSDGGLFIGGRIVKLVEKALLAQAEILAIKDVEQMEKSRKQSQDEARIDRAIDRAMKF
jgi:hypothetical protein